MSKEKEKEQKKQRFTDRLVGLGKELFEKESGDEYIEKERKSWEKEED